MEPAEEYKSIQLIIREPDKITRIGSNMSKSVQTLMIKFVRKSIDMFAWSPSDFKGIDPEVIVYRLNVDPMVRPVKQKKRSFGAERNFIIKEENAGATYQRLGNRIFKDKIGTTMEVYVDDMLVKSREKDHLEDLKQAFEIMRAYGMKLNPSKCTFGVRGGKFLGYMVSWRGIEANPKRSRQSQNFDPPKH
ncbi:UNVERIFIED_CONTAM: hypothetical protein Sradi_4387700 [Sesamum radiatum]|uniref:Reverse transcriptase domain-containing protein n=1 Tax=Sesamum radiatum TaxID=300843 RepID=A0AAW2NSK6_SESRA